MPKIPYLNALFALLYITTIALIMNFGMENLGPVDSIFAPIAMISLFTLSAAVMGYLFLYQPFLLYFEEKKKKAAVDYFLKTVLVFAGITIFALALLFSGIISY